MASPLNRRNASDRDELDIEALFASEPEAAEPRRPDTPKLIFTQPADRNVQQFADEPAQFAEEADPLAVTLLPAQAPPYHARWNEVEPPGRGRSGLMLGAFALLLAVGVAASLMMPRGDDADPGGQPTEATVPSGATPEFGPPEPPTAARPRPETQLSAANVPAPTRQPRVPQPDAQKTAPPPAPRRVATPDAPRTAATSGRASNTGPPVSTRGVAVVPPPTAPPPPDVRRLNPEAAIPLGQPLATPRETAPALREASPAPRLEPTPVPAAPAAPPPAPAAAALDPRAVETDRVRAVLSGYERAYSALDADAASRVFPAVDRKALSRAFSGLSAQQIRFDDCRIQVQQASARATCAGTLRWTPKVGGGSRQQARRWQFDLQQVPGGWRIGEVKVQ
ncbi:MAG: hypothetical protein ABIX28_13905 [Vicinamibacterales bacterium]